MRKRDLILIATPIFILTGYLIYRNRKPSIRIMPNIDWREKIPTIRFGNNTESLNKSEGVLNAGVTYSEKYLLYYKKTGNKMVLEVKNRYGEIYESKTIDFQSKIIY